MNPFDGRYFKINQCLLSFVGLWPYQDASAKRFAMSWTVFGVLSFCIPQVLYLLKFLNDVDRVLSGLPAMMGGLMMTSKLFSFWYKSIETKALLDRMRECWGSLSRVNEMEILRKSAENAFIIVCGTYYFLVPWAGPLLDMIMPLNETRPRIFIHPVEYPFDQQKYYYPLLLNQYFSYVVCFISVVGTDLLFIVLVEDVCGVLSILNHRLRNISECNTNDRQKFANYSFKERNSTVYQDAVDCVRLHLTAKQLVQMLQSAFALYFIVEFSLGIVMHSTSCVMWAYYEPHCTTVFFYGFYGMFAKICVFIILPKTYSYYVQSMIRMDRPDELSKYVGMAIVQTLRLFVNSLPGQKLMDYSGITSIAAYTGLWYKTTPRVKEVLLLLMINNHSPPMLTVGSLYTINLISFSMVTESRGTFLFSFILKEVIKTSVSYCTIMGSLHDRQQSS